MKYKHISFFLISAISLMGCQNDETFDNKVFTVLSQGPVATTMVKAGVTELTQTVQAAVPSQVDQDVTITYQVDANKVEIYNRAYDEKAVILPAEFYEMPKGEVMIYKGATESTALEIRFKQLNLLNRQLTYVLPITIASAGGLNILESAKEKYFVFKAGALINVVGKIANNFLSINWKNKDPFRSLSTFTMEALVRAQNFDRQISTIMGIEGTFLLRCGDSSYPSNQLQVSVGRDFFPGADNKKGLPTNKWVHIAVTYDANAGLKIYVDGQLQSDGPDKRYGPINLSGGGNDFYIGKSWDDARFLAGDIAECRIWNVVRTREEIANNFYYVDPNSAGLIAYWKFDEGEGTLVRDHSSNGNDAQANSSLQWVPVELPVMKK